MREEHVHTAGAVCLTLAARYIGWMMTNPKVKLPDDFLQNTLQDFINTIEANIEMARNQGGRLL